MTIGMIVAVSPDGVIGQHGKIPWHYPADLKRFKALTLDATVIMGRSTYESIGKPLPKRRNIAITSQEIAGIDCFRDIPSALATCSGRIWFIGGARIYREAMTYVDLIDVTYVPDRIEGSGLVYFPMIDETVFVPGPREKDPDDPRLEHRSYRRRS